MRPVEGNQELLEDTAAWLLQLTRDGHVLWSYGSFDPTVIEAQTGIAVPILDASRLHHLVDQRGATQAGPLKRAIERTFKVQYVIDALDSIGLAVDDPAFLEYAALDALGLRALLEVWRQVQLPSDDWTEDGAITWVDREMRIQHIADEIGHAGVLVSPRRCDAILIELADELAAAQVELDRQAPGINPRSPKQVIEHLEADGVTIPRKRRPKTGEYTKSVASKLIKRIDHPLVDAIVSFRQTAASINTIEQLMFAAGIDDEADFPQPARCTYRALGARTSRWSSSKPNLQNIPKGRLRDVMVSPLDLEDELAGDEEELSPRIAEVLVPRRGYVFVQADLSQIEYRVGAMLSGDERMREIYLSGEGDLHIEAARVLFGVDRPNKDHRQAAKGIGFGKFYGLSLRSMAEEARVSVDSMSRRVERYDAAFPGLKRWTDKVTAIAAASGRTLRAPFGRTFKVPRPGLHGRQLPLPVHGPRGVLRVAAEHRGRARALAHRRCGARRGAARGAARSGRQGDGHARVHRRRRRRAGLRHPDRRRGEVVGHFVGRCLRALIAPAAWRTPDGCWRGH